MKQKERFGYIIKIIEILGKADEKGNKLSIDRRMEEWGRLLLCL